MSQVRPILAGLPLAVLLVLPSCLAPKPEPDDWLAWGYRSPEATARSFLTALGADRPDLEYRCLSENYKKKAGGNLLAYLILRDQLRADMPWMRAAVRTEVVSIDRPSDDRAHLVGRIDWLFWDKSFAVDLVAEDYYEWWLGDERIDDGFHPLTILDRGEYEARFANLVLAGAPAPEDVALGDITELRVGTEWKIDGISLLDPEP
jgi:hypothetical protein